MAGRRVIVLAVVAALAVAGGLYAWAHRFEESTDDAALEAHVVPIAAKLPGYIAAVLVDDNQVVKQGDVLVRIDPTDYAIAYERASAAMASAQARLDKANADLKRQNALTSLTRSQQQLTDAEAAAKDAVAELAHAKAEQDAAVHDQSNTAITAPFDGRVARKGVEPGQYVQPGQQLMALVGTDLWVVANYKETQLTHMKPGQPVTISVDAYPGRSYRGHVDSVEAGTGARFSMFPPENATGNFVKVVQRVPVKLLFDEPLDGNLAFGAGMSVAPVVNTQ